MDNKVIINAVGDVWFGDHAVTVGHGVRSTLKKKGMEYLFRDIAHLFVDSDINFCNLECVLSDIGLRKWYLPSYEMRGFPECIEALKKLNFNIINVANNHIMQHGKKAYLQTIKLLDNNGIKYIGVDGPNNTIMQTYKKEEIQIGFIGFSLHPEEYYRDQPLYSYRKSFNILSHEFRKIRESFDGLLFVSIHWGKEFVHCPSLEQISQARFLIDEGATVVLGHHPHVLQGIEEYKKGLIAYSLGNFVFDLWEENTKQTIILKIIVDNNGINDYSAIPVYINKQYQPVPAVGKMATKILNNLKNYSTIFAEEPSHFHIWEYNKHLKNTGLKFKLSSYKYFLRNIKRYSLNIVFQSFFRAFIRKIFAKTL